MTGQSSALVPLYAPVSSSCSSSVFCSFSFVPLFFVNCSGFFLAGSRLPCMCFQCLRSPISGFLPFCWFCLFFLPLSVLCLWSSLFPQSSASPIFFFFCFLLPLLGSALFSPILSCDLSFSAFYSQRTMLFLPTIDCRCNGGGRRPLKKMNSTSPQTTPF